MKLNLNNLGRISAEYPKTFFRVEKWSNGARVADFTTEAEAAAFAIENAREVGCRYDHKVCRMSLSC